MNGPFLFHPMNRAGVPFCLRQIHTAKHSGLQRAIRRTSATAVKTSAAGAATTMCSSTAVDVPLVIAVLLTPDLGPGCARLEAAVRVVDYSLRAESRGLAAAEQGGEPTAVGGAEFGAGPVEVALDGAGGDDQPL